MNPPSRLRRIAVYAAAALCVLSVLAGGVAAQDESPNPTCAGTIDRAAGGVTVISVQGVRFGDGPQKKPAKLVGVGPNGQILWVHKSAEKYGVTWSYDVDPLPNGNVFVTATIPQHKTLVYELNPRTQEQVWSKEFDMKDTHDADLIDNGSKIVFATMRNYDEESDQNRDSIRVYDREQEEFVWRWNFRDHFGREVGGNYTNDWTHVNDVDAVGDDQFVISPRNFDQVLLINRTTKEIDMTLGEYGNKNVLAKQHNPDYLESEDGTPTLLVADSDNDRIVEYAKQGEVWERTWTLGQGDTFNWPRDADRLRNGNTLVSDSIHNRVVEVTPEGEVVWEFYSPWLVYDAARLSNPDESAGPTIADQGAVGSYDLSGSANRHENASAMESCHQTLQAFENPDTVTTPDVGTGTTTGDDPPESPAGGDTESDTETGVIDGQPGFGLVAALGALAALALVAVARRD